MRKLFTLLFCLFIANLTFGQTKQFTLVTKQTADWCPNCGSWGWNFAKNLRSKAQDENLIYIGMHHSGGLANAMTKEFAENFGGTYQPVFFLNQDNLNVISSNANAKVDEALSTIQALNGFPAAVAIDIEPKLVGENITFKTEVEFLENAQGEYYYGQYLVRNNLIHMQSNQGQNASHPNVLDRSFFANTFGDSMNGNNPIDKSTKFTFEGEMTDVVPHSNNLEDMLVIGIIWYKVNDQYTFVNGNIAPVSEGSTTNTLDLDGLTFEIIPQVNGFILETNQLLAQDATVNMTSVDGKSININITSLGDNSISASYGSIVTGAYVISLFNEGRITNRLIYVQ